ncbi:MAG TPA: NAD-dependent isocitrate dehydrogenase, partial [Xanthomonadales bacterium]|nr:NAD-dependent isocitrate dehydrogenase [Xanthomonadales bacterium]
AARLRQAITATLEAKDRLTGDLGGSAGTEAFTDALISRL